jgi:hypothetical protein
VATRVRHHGLMRATAVRHRTRGRMIATLVLLTGMAACTDDTPEPPPGPHEDHVALELTMGPGASGLSPEARDQLQNDVGAVLSTYVVEAFLGDYPRDDFVDALDSFTSGVADEGAAHLGLITGAGFGKDVESVTATRLTATISTFAPEGRALGASADVDFAFTVEAGGTTRQATRRGRLMLVTVDGEWKIFGYDLAPERSGGA